MVQPRIMYTRYLDRGVPAGTVDTDVCKIRKCNKLIKTLFGEDLEVRARLSETRSGAWAQVGKTLS